MGRETFRYGSSVGSSQVHPRRKLILGWNYRTLEQVGGRYFSRGMLEAESRKLGDIRCQVELRQA